MNIMEFALNLEKEAEDFYRQQAEKNKDNKVHGMFASLADDERMHAEILRKKSHDLDNLPESNITEDQQIFTDENYFKSEYKKNPKQIDFYREALQKEQESIDIYKKLMSENQENEKLYKYLIAQETKHYNLIYNLITLLERAESWVEAPEFGIREDY